MLTKARIVLFFAAIAASETHVLAAQTASADTLQGQVTTDTARHIGVAAATITITRGPDRAVYTTRTDSTGRWRLVVDSGTGDYLVHVAKDLFVTQRRRITQQRGERTLVASFVLKPSNANTLTQITVRASRRSSPRRHEDDLEPNWANVEAVVEGVDAGVSPADDARLDAMLATVPGVLVTATGASALGLSAQHSLTTLNGMRTEVTTLPRGLSTTVRVATTAWDVARGGFSGISTDVALAPGTAYSRRLVSVAADAPPLQATDALGRSLGARLQRYDASVTSDGPVDRRGHFTYVLGGRAQYASRPFATLDRAPAAVLQSAGVPAAQRTRLLDALGSLRVPTVGAQALEQRSVSLVGRVDRARLDADLASERPRTYGAVGLFEHRSTAGAALTPLSLATAATGSTVTVGGVQLSHSVQHAGWLHDTRVAISASRTQSAPAVSLPSAVVLGDATRADAIAVPLGFGGSDVASGVTLRRSAELTHVSESYADAAALRRRKVFLHARVDAAADRRSNGGNGTYVYESIDAVRTGEPMSFTRTLGERQSAATTFNGAIGFGEIYKPTPSVTVQYGTRLEASIGSAQINGVTAIAQQLGARVSTQPRDFAVAPRLAVRKVFHSSGSNRDEIRTYRFGTDHRDVRGVLRAGIGEFRSYFSPEDMLFANDQSSLLTLNCLDAAVPAPDWQAFEATGDAPVACSGGASQFGSRLSDGTTLASNWRAPRSWRANIGWTMRVANLDVVLEAVANATRNLSSSVDINLRGAPVLISGDNSRRPIFVGAGSIASSGAWSALDASRVDPAVGVVRVTSASGRATAQQFRITVKPRWAGRLAALTYVAQRARSFTNGFDATTDGDPRAQSWAPSSFDSHHQIQGQYGADWRGVSLTGFLNARSGSPYTPLVLGDVNGDGLRTNDRATLSVWAPGSETMVQRLLNSPDGQIRACVRGALGRIPEQNSCRSAWSATFNAALSWNATSDRLGGGTRVSLYLQNVLGGVDAALHGANVRGWGGASAPDPFLVRALAWSDSAKSFVYAVNPHFGSNDVRSTSIRVPFRITLAASVPLGSTVSQQQLTQALRPGRDGASVPPLDSATLHRRYARSVPSVYAYLAVESDSLLLTATQLSEMQRRFAAARAQSDAIVGRLAGAFARLAPRFDVKAAYREQEQALDALWEIQRVEATKLQEFLSPTQLALLPPMPAYLRRIKAGQKVRVFF